MTQDYDLLVGKWLLVKKKGSNVIEEVLVLETSPSKKYLKIFEGVTVKWIAINDYDILEVLY